jgi:hypothetical protein
MQLATHKAIARSRLTQSAFGKPSHALPRRPRSAGRTRSPTGISQKREFSEYPLETIGYFALKMPKVGVWRPAVNSQKPAIGGPFCEHQGRFGGARHWLAGAGGFEPRYDELESDALACPRRAAEPHFVEIYMPFETLEFREPYRNRRVQSFGDK